MSIGNLSNNYYNDIINKFENLKNKLNLDINNYKDAKTKYELLLHGYNVNLKNKSEISQFDSTIFPITFTTNNTILVKRSKGGSFPRFAFKSGNNIIVGSNYNRVQITFRWAGTQQAYDYYNLGNKKWCIGIGNGASGCRTNEQPMPPKTGEYVTYIVSSTHGQWISSNLQWINWVGPSFSYDLKNDAVWEFKQIDILISSTYKNNIFNDVKLKYQLVNTTVNDMNNLIQQLLVYDIIGKNEINSTWNKMIEDTNELKVDYNKLLTNLSNEDDLRGQHIEQNSFLTINSIKYSGWIILNIILITTLIRNMSN